MKKKDLIIQENIFLSILKQRKHLWRKIWKLFGTLFIYVCTNFKLDIIKF